MQLAEAVYAVSVVSDSKLCSSSSNCVTVDTAFFLVEAVDTVKSYLSVETCCNLKSVHYC